MNNKGIQLIDSKGNKVYPNPFPIGAIYMSVDQKNPNLIFGGTWEQIKDKFILGCGNKFTPGSSGGEINHILSITEMPSHNHSAWTTTAGEHQHSMWFGGGANNGTGAQIPVANTRWGQDTAGMSTGGHSHGVEVGYNGNNTAHNNMPPYIAVYIWKRTG